ncbi:MAG: UvrD-helicase domain-containing protein [Bacteroidaceae bacterium]|nr:UvrD-helicase domain-containing protein [Bacteroidaceae bacterium]
MKNYLETFNPPQRAAVEYCEGPSLVIAGAGSGKTRVLTYKIAYLMEHGYQPWSILALTFTNKAAGEMKDRIAKIVGVDYARMLWMGTFHSIFLRILRQEHEKIGFSSNFTIYDAADSKSLVKSIIKEMELDDKTYKPGTVQGIISNAKNQLVTAEQYASNPANRQSDARHNMAALGQIFLRYCNRCKQSDAMDFDDILLYTYLLFEKHPDVLAKWEQRFRYVLVDEYQDTNFAQHRIVWQLTRQHQHVCVVGDDAQSIYSFRGANIDNILTFQKIYESARLFKLERNYRSTQNIVEAANSLIKKNSRQIQKDIFSENDRGEKLHVMDTHSDIEEAKMVVNAIRGIKRKEGCEYSDFAILYRTNAQSRVFEDTMRKESLPYRIYGGLSFYQRKEIKDVIAYFRLAVNPNDEEAFKRVINYPARGIGQTTVTKILSAATEHEVSLWTVINNPEQYELGVNKGTLTKIGAFREMIASFIENAQKMPANQVGTMIVKQSGIIADIYQDTTPENLSRQENVEELVNGMQDFCDMRMEEGNENISLSDYLSEVSLMSDVDSDKGDDEHKITLMTIHSAKGLEFGTVFVVGLEEGLFPSDMVSGNPREMEEERRLFYVAITRAKTHCYLSYAQCRFRYGQMEFSAPSRFLKDIDPKYLDRQQSMFSTRRSMDDEVELPWQRKRSLFGERQETPRPFRPTVPSAKPFPSASPFFSARPVPSTGTTTARPLSSVSQTTSFPQGTSSHAGGGLKEGAYILHNRFGRGKVLKVEGTGDNTKATVQFENVGTKQLLLKFAKFEVIG